MKHLITLLACIITFGQALEAQQVPNGMKYQAVARDMKGHVLANRDLQLRISLYADPHKKSIDYIEIHKAITNDLGLFSLTVGEGFVTKGSFGDIPWSSGEVWMEVAIQADDFTEFVVISDSRMLSVPYAFHALTASEIVGANTGGSRGGGPADPPTDWLLIGNKGTDPAIHKLGTTDRVDLVVVTNDTERIRILSSGEVVVRSDFIAEQNVLLNALGGETINNGNLTVGGKTLLQDNLGVEGAAYLNDRLEVDSTALFKDETPATSPSTGALVVKGGVGIGGDLHVAGSASFGGAASFGGPLHLMDTTQSVNDTTGALIVDGGVGIAKNLNVGGRMGVKTDNSGFAAVVENTNGMTGDGIQIKLGRTHPAYDGGYLNIPDPGSEMFDNNIGLIKGWIDGEPFEYEDVLDFISPLWIAGTACMLVEKLGGVLNDAMGLPAGVPPLTDLTIFNAVNSFADELIPDDWAPDNPTTLIPGFTLQFPTDFCPDVLPSFTMPYIAFQDVPNSLTNENQFLSFVDNQDRELGSIRAQSVEDWGDAYFDYQYLVEFIANVVSLDPLDITLSCVKEFSYLADSYNSIGVEYTSGHGDYAEWLERVNATEVITRGDIVAVRGGKITKDLTDAEQVMAVSEHPIMLGNLPPKGDEDKGNNVAFMGQIPVKIMGPVATGDYILAGSDIPGYGIARAPQDLTPEDMRFVVGRAWETKPGEGPKMVNTVVGIHNGDYVRILQQYEKRISATEARLDNLSRESASRMEALESRVDQLMERLDAPANKVTYKQ